MRFYLTVAILAACALTLSATSPKSVASDSEGSFRLLVSRQMLAASGRIFSGTVLRVEHRNSNSPIALATTKITFHVDESIRNVRRGQTLEINEWAGLWQSGERYRPGERVLLFLYPPSRLGLTSPVGNRAGRFDVDRVGRVILNAPPGTPPRSISIRRAVAAIREAEKDRLR